MPHGVSSEKIAFGFPFQHDTFISVTQLLLKQRLMSFYESTGRAGGAGNVCEPARE
jgi:hypothetical protein